MIDPPPERLRLVVLSGVADLYFIPPTGWEIGTDYVRADVVHNPIVKPIAEPTAGPVYYRAGGVEPIDYIRAQGWLPDFAAGNIVKYVTRYRMKDGARDLRKARRYLDWLIECAEAEEAGKGCGNAEAEEPTVGLDGGDSPAEVGRGE